MRYIAIDLGSSFIKHGLLDLAEGNINGIGKLAPSSRLDSEDAHTHELSAEAIFRSVEGMVASYTREDPSIRGMIMSTQMHGFVLTHPDLKADIYVSWQDTRCLKMASHGESYIEQLKTKIPAEFMREAGVPLKPMLGLCNLCTLLQEVKIDPAIRPRLFTLGSYIIYRLTGRNITHITNAAPLGLVDIKSRTWHQGIIKAAGLEHLEFPEITESLGPVGLFKGTWATLNVLPDIGDQQAAILGCGARAGDVIVNVGTAAQIAHITDRFMPGDHETRPYFGTLVLDTFSRMPGGRNIDVVIAFIDEIGREIFKVPESAKIAWDYFNKGFSLGDPNGLAVDTSFYDMPHKLAGGAIYNIGKSNLTVANLFSGIIRDMASVYARYITALCGDLDPEVRILFSGGVSWNNPVLLKAVAEETGRKVELSPMKDEVFSGLFRAALIGSGTARDMSEALAVNINASEPA